MDCREGLGTRGREAGRAIQGERRQGLTGGVPVGLKRGDRGWRGDWRPPGWESGAEGRPVAYATS